MTLEYEDDFDRYSDDFDELDEDETVVPSVPKAHVPAPCPEKAALVQALPLAMGETTLLYQQRPMSQQDKYIEGICREQSTFTGSQFASRGTSTYMQPPTADAECQVPAFTSRLTPQESVEYFSGLFEAVFGHEGGTTGEWQMEGGAQPEATRLGQRANKDATISPSPQGIQEESQVRDSVHSGSEDKLLHLSTVWCKEHLALLIADGSADMAVSITPLRAVKCAHSFFVSLEVELGKAELLSSDDYSSGKPFYSATAGTADFSSISGVYPLTRSRRKQRLHGFFDLRGQCLALYANDIAITCSAERASFFLGSAIHPAPAFVPCGTESGILLLLLEPDISVAQVGCPQSPPVQVQSLMTPIRASSALPHHVASEVTSLAPITPDSSQFVTLHRGGELLLWQFAQSWTRVSVSPLLDQGETTDIWKTPEKLYQVMLGKPALSTGACVLRDGTVILGRDWRRIAESLQTKEYDGKLSHDSAYAGIAPSPVPGASSRILPGNSLSIPADIDENRDLVFCTSSRGVEISRVATVVAMGDGDVVDTGYALVFCQSGIIYGYASLSARPAFTAMLTRAGAEVVTGQAPKSVLRLLERESQLFRVTPS